MHSTMRADVFFFKDVVDIHGGIVILEFRLYKAIIQQFQPDELLATLTGDELARATQVLKGNFYMKILDSYQTKTLFIYLLLCADGRSYSCI